jgi:hypothetical protein
VQASDHLPVKAIIAVRERCRALPDLQEAAVFIK